MNDFVAHIKLYNDDEKKAYYHLLAEHLKGVALLASEFAEPFGCRNFCYAAGLIHDIGKFSDAFQKYIRAAVFDMSYDHKNRKGSVDHSTAGAIYAANNKMPILDYLSVGHHSGLQDYTVQKSRLAKKECLDLVANRAKQFFLENKIPPLESFDQ